MKCGIKYKTNCETKCGIKYRTKRRTNSGTLSANNGQTLPVFVRIRKWMLLCLLPLLTSCERRELTYYNTAEITLTVDWSQSGLDNAEEAAHGATAIFYPVDGGEPQTFLLGNYSQETVRLQQGVYNIIVFNRSFTDFSNIAFRGGDKYETLEAYNKKTETRIAGKKDVRTVIAPPEKLAAATVADFAVTQDMLGNYTRTTTGKAAYPATANDESHALHLIPQKRTSEVVTLIRVEGLNNIRSAVCRLDGISESVFLATGEVSAQGISQEFALTNPVFDENSSRNGTLTGTFNVFGINFSQNHQLHLEAQLVDGETVFTGDYDNVQVTEKDNGEGVVTIYVEAATDKIPDVEPDSKSGSGFDVDVDGWGDEVNTDVPLQ